MVAVIVNHLTGWPGGGFVGVDIFFVISGFLITGLLLRERRTAGRISLSEFYIRRIRRILPAAVLVLVVTVLASFFLLNAGRGKQTLVDAAWSVFFSSNWHFAWTGTDYFHVEGSPSPLTHFWSLAVEEQFYLVWPWLVVAGYALVSHRVAYASRIGHRLVGAVTALLVMVSFGYACALALRNPTWAYFSTFARAWELGVGALLAVSAAALTSIPAAWRPPLAWLGLLGIFASFVLIDDNTAIPGPWGVLPVLSAALVLAAGTGARLRSVRPLTSPVSVWIGTLSYSLYLWHFPVAALLPSVLPESSVLYYVSASVLILGLSVASYYGVEDPVRKSSWLLGRSPQEKRRQLQPWSRSRRPRLVGVGCLAVGCLMFVGFGVTRQQSSNATAPPDPPPSWRFATAGAESVTDPRSDRTKAVRAALAASAWPKLTPSVDEVRTAVASTPCALSFQSPPLFAAAEIRQRCVQGDPAASQTVLVVGDSLANSYLPAIVTAVAPEGWNVIGLTRSGCPAIQIKLRLQGTSRRPYPQCDEQQALLVTRMRELQPDLIVVANSLNPVRGLLASNATGLEAHRQWAEAAKASWAAFAETAPVVVLQGPPRGEDLQTCATRFSKPAACVSTPTATYFSFAKTEKAAVKALHNREVRYVSTQDWFCSEEARCPGFVDGTPIFADGGHLTVQGARALAPLVRKALSKPMAA